MAFYTFVSQLGNKIISRGIENDGTRFTLKEDYCPTLFTYSSNDPETPWKDLHGRPVYEVKPGNINDCRDFIGRYKDVQGYQILGNTNWYIQYISDTYPNDIILNMNRIRVNYIDIETTVGDKFPDYKDPVEEILLISNYDNIEDRYFVYTSTNVDLETDLIISRGIDPAKAIVKYHLNEEEMLRGFIADWTFNYPDIVTGWNTELFDIPYLINRCYRIVGEKVTKRLSPFGTINERQLTIGDKENTLYEIVGINHLDYIVLMKKYTYGVRDSWKLDDIAFQELGEKKLEYDGSFKDFYTSDFNRFTTYNIIDSHLVRKLDEKLKLIELLMTIAYDAKVAPEDVLSQLKTWDGLIYNYLKRKNIVIPNKNYHAKTSYEGAFVMDPQVGKHKWIMSYDLASLYPSIIIHYNMSPETMVDYMKEVTVDGIIDQRYDNSDLVEEQVAMTANGVCYRKDIHGFMPEIVNRIYNERSTAKKQMLKLEQEYETTKDVNLKSEISRYHNIQLAKKTIINSLYGALGANSFRFYDLRMAEGITLSGQLAIKWIGKEFNVLMNKLCKTSGVNYLVYGDTDSVYVTFEKFVDKYYSNLTDEQIVVKLDELSNKIVQPALDKSYQKMADYLNAYEQKMIMKREAIADSGVFVAKKKYALSVHNSEGVQYDEPKLKATGLDLVRSSTPLIVRKYLKDGIREILWGTEESVQAFIIKCQKDYNTKPYHEIAFPRGVNGMTKFAGSPIYSKGCPIHVRGALLYNHYVDKLGLSSSYEKIGDGNKIRFIYTKLPNPLKENVIGYLTKIPKEFNIESYVDYPLMFQKSFVDSMKIIMEPLGWSTEEQSSLEDFFC